MAIRRTAAGRLRDIAAGRAVDKPSDPGALTDSTGETADTTIAQVDTAVTGVDGTGSNAASKADVDNRLDLINKNFADLTKAVNDLRSALVKCNLI